MAPLDIIRHGCRVVIFFVLENASVQCRAEWGTYRTLPHGDTQAVCDVVYRSREDDDSKASIYIDLASE
jgi:hypothetical protein